MISLIQKSSAAVIPNPITKMKINLMLLQWSNRNPKNHSCPSGKLLLSASSTSPIQTLGTKKYGWLKIEKQDQIFFKISFIQKSRNNCWPEVSSVNVRQTYHRFKICASFYTTLKTKLTIFFNQGNINATGVEKSHFDVSFIWDK